MRYSDKFIVSLDVQNILDSYFTEIYEKGEKKSVKEISNELGNVSAGTIYNYIRMCSGEMKKATIYRYMMYTIKFNRGHAEYCDIQKQYLERHEEIQKLKRRKEAISIVKKLYERQQLEKSSELKGGK